MSKLTMLQNVAMPLVVAMIVVGTMLVIGCEKQEIETLPQATQNQQHREQPQQSDTRLYSLVNTSWQLVAFVENNVSRTPEHWPQINPYPFLLNFYQDSISGVACCNEINGRFSCDSVNTTIRIGTMTYMNECDDGFLYQDRINESSTYKINDDTMKLYVDENNYLVFRSTAISPTSFLLGEWAVNASMSEGIFYDYKDTLVFTTSGIIERHSGLAGCRYYLLNDTTIRIEGASYMAYNKNLKYYSPNGIMFYNFWDNTIASNVKNIYYERVQR